MDCLMCNGDGVTEVTCPTCGNSEEVVECPRCEGAGEEKRYVIPLKTAKSYLQTHKADRGEFLKLACIGKFDPDYNQLGRNFASYLQRNCPIAYVQGVLAKLEKMAIDGRL